MLAPSSDRPATALPATYFAYGVALAADFPLSYAGRRPGATSLRKVSATLLPEDEALSSWSGTDRGPVLAPTMSDGVTLSVFAGVGGDLLARYGNRGAFLVSADTERLSCSRAVAADDPGWHRVLLDWVMYFIASLRGTQALHASSAVVGEQVIAFCALSGGGKTSAVLELVNSGAQLMSDDVLCLDRVETRVTGQPGGPFLNLVDPDARQRPPGALAGVIGDEQWVQVEHAAHTSVPIGAVFLLDRSDHFATLRAADCSLFELRRHAVGLPHLVGDERTRFTLLADLMSQARVCRIEAPMGAPPHAIAEFARDLSVGLAPAVEAV